MSELSTLRRSTAQTKKRPLFIKKDLSFTLVPALRQQCLWSHTLVHPSDHIQEQGCNPCGASWEILWDILKNTCVVSWEILLIPVEIFVIQSTVCVFLFCRNLTTYIYYIPMDVMFQIRHVGFLLFRKFVKTVVNSFEKKVIYPITRTSCPQVSPG